MSMIYYAHIVADLASPNIMISETLKVVSKVSIDLVMKSALQE